MRKVFAFIFAGVLGASGASAQTPAPPPMPESRVFSMVFDSSGGYLGIQTTEVTKDNFTKFGLRDVRGVAVEKVVEGSPAASAGVQAGDVIVSFGDETGPCSSICSRRTARRWMNSGRRSRSTARRQLLARGVKRLVPMCSKTKSGKGAGAHVWMWVRISSALQPECPS